MHHGDTPRWDPLLNDVLVTVLRREREAEVTKMEYLVLAQAIITGVEKSRVEQTFTALNNLKKTMAEKVHFDAYDTQYLRMKQLVAKKKETSESEILDKVAKLGR